MTKIPFRILSLSFICLTLTGVISGCDKPTSLKDHAPVSIESIDLSQLLEPTPVKLEPTKAGNRSPYEVNGITYQLLDSSEGYKETGLASWYGMKFHGNPTSNGEIFDAYKLTAAHKTLPIPCFARVTHLENGNSIVVRINDRGPFIEGRIIDLSWAAAAKLGMIDEGVSEVTIEVISIAE